jgi:signal transduction histidine kinase
MAPKRSDHLRLMAGGRHAEQPLPRGARSRTAPDRAPARSSTPPASDLEALQVQHAALLRTNEAFAGQLQEAQAQLTTTVKDLHDEVARHGEKEHRWREQMSQQRALSVEATVAEQREHRRLASLLTEELQQLLAAVKYKIALLAQSRQRTLPPAWADVSGLVDAAVRCSRSIGGDLGPTVLQPGELFPALCWLRVWMAERHQFLVELHTDGGAEPVHEAVALLLFQAVRELLCNTQKYAQVATARVELTRKADALQVTVSDAGIGFEVAELSTRKTGGLGLRSIRQRLEYLGGQLDIASAPGQGSRFTLMVPLHA